MIREILNMLSEKEKRYDLMMHKICKKYLEIIEGEEEEGNE